MPTTKESLLLITCHFLLSTFHNPISYPSLTSLDTNPLTSSHSFPLITWFQKAPLSFANLQLYLQMPHTWLWYDRVLVCFQPWFYLSLSSIWLILIHHINVWSCSKDISNLILKSLKAYSWNFKSLSSMFKGVWRSCFKKFFFFFVFKKKNKKPYMIFRKWSVF